MTNAQAKIQLSGVRKAFGPKLVLDDVNLDINTGESVVIIGGSGTGKSVTLKCILGLLKPDAGEIKVDGQSVVGISDEERAEINDKFGMLFQGAALFDSLPVWENVSFGLLAQKKVDRAKAKDIAVEKLALTGLAADVADMSPAELSGGMQKRVGLARAIASDPEIIFFDEPTTGLDPIMADVINNLIVKITRELGVTALSITHDMASARKIANRIAMLYNGEIIWFGSTSEIENSRNPYVDQFIHGRAEGPIQTEGPKQLAG
jgi:phospholipid/cholesterol/gamma-HCH transport system ATP-binding protein